MNTATELPKSIQEAASSPVRRHQNGNAPQSEAPAEPSPASTSAKPQDPGFPNLESLVLAHADEIGKGDNKPFEVTVGIYSRFVFTDTAANARKIICTEVRAVKDPEIIAAMAANIPKQKAE